jgi:hypothetical protein
MVVLVAFGSFITTLLGGYAALRIGSYRYLLRPEKGLMAERGSVRLPGSGRQGLAGLLFMGPGR